MCHGAARATGARLPALLASAGSAAGTRPPRGGPSPLTAVTSGKTHTMRLEHLRCGCCGCRQALAGARRQARSSVPRSTRLSACQPKKTEPRKRARGARGPGANLPWLGMGVPPQGAAMGPTRTVSNAKGAWLSYLRIPRERTRGPGGDQQADRRSAEQPASPGPLPLPPAPAPAPAARAASVHPRTRRPCIRPLPPQLPATRTRGCRPRRKWHSPWTEFACTQFNKRLACPLLSWNLISVAALPFVLFNSVPTTCYNPTTSCYLQVRWWEPEAQAARAGP